MKEEGTRKILKNHKIKKNNLYRLQNEKIVFLIMAIGFCLIIIICAFFHWHENIIKEIKISDYTILEDSVLYCVDDANYEMEVNGDSMLYISGWCIIKGKTIEKIKMNVLLRDKEKNTYYKLPTYLVKREDVTNAIDDGFDYDNSGFKVRISNPSKINFSNKNNIYILYNINDIDYIIDLNKTLEENIKDEE